MLICIRPKLHQGYLSANCNIYNVLNKHSIAAVPDLNSGLQILLFAHNQENVLKLEKYLFQVQSLPFQIIKLEQLTQLLAHAIQPTAPKLLLLLEPPQDATLNLLAQIRRDNQLPTLLIASLSAMDSQTWLMGIDQYMPWEQLSIAFLEKLLLQVWHNYQTQYELQSLRVENNQLARQLQSIRELFQAIVDNSSTMIWMCDAQGNSTFFNQAWNRILGRLIKPQEQKNWMMNIHPHDLELCQTQFSKALAAKQSFTLDYRLQNSQGEYRWISNYAIPQFTLNENFTGFVGYCFEITVHKQIEQQLIEKATSDRLIAQISQKIHTTLDLLQILQTTVQEVNQFLQGEKIQILQLDSDTNFSLLFESRLHEYQLSCNLAEAKHLPQEMFNQNISELSLGKSVAQNRPQSPTLPQEAACSTLLVPIQLEQQLWGLIHIEQCSQARQWTQEEISWLERIALELGVAIKQARLYQQLEQANRELEQLSLIDSLTEIANRRRFDHYIFEEWGRSAREQNPLSLIICDIDYFKCYNDTYGHQGGDLCLRRVAQAIRKVARRPADLAARYGGEEFVLVLPNTPLDGAKYLAQKLKRQVESLKIPHIGSPIDLYLTISLGIACCIPRPNSSYQMLIAAADQGLYLAKEQGRNRAVEYEVKFE